jgi:hypothetical protein
VRPCNRGGEYTHGYLWYYVLYDTTGCFLWVGGIEKEQRGEGEDDTQPYICFKLFCCITYICIYNRI